MPCPNVSILHPLFHSNLNIWYILYLGKCFLNCTSVLYSGINILLHLFYSHLIIQYLLLRRIVCKLGQYALLKLEHPWAPILLKTKNFIFFYIGWGFLSWANVLCSNMSILHHLFDSNLNFRYFFYLNGYFVNWANAPCSNVSIPHRLFDFNLNVRTIFYISR